MLYHHFAAGSRRGLCVLLICSLLSACCIGGCADPTKQPSASETETTDVYTEDSVSADIPESDTIGSITDAPETTAPVTDEPDTTAPVTDEAVSPDTETPKPPSPVHITIPRLSKKSIAEAKQILTDAAIAYTVKEEYSTKYTAGTVLNVRFYGKADEDSLHINPAQPVEVTVSLGTKPKICVTAVDEKRIYLTFDDGPYIYTQQVLDTLAAYGVRATFFTIGMFNATYPDKVRAIADGGHLLACHSYTHDYKSLYSSAASTLSEIRMWEQSVEAAGVTLPEKRYFRFPGGTTTTYMDNDRYEDIFWAVTENGYNSMDWTFANNDRYLTPKPEEQPLDAYLMESMITTLRNCAYNKSKPKIMLLHDTAKETVDMLGWIIETLLAEGYTFGTLDELDGYWVFK
ncbi:MAG: polysaccharide deacetylase family protein [Clostridia bacterium]|nr:polysaccharide deacetylase family protein [Clostridia bacterium]